MKKVQIVVEENDFIKFKQLNNNVSSAIRKLIKEELLKDEYKKHPEN